MANNGSRRVNSRTEHYAYDGNAVRKLQAIPQEVPQKKRVSRTATRNRKRAKSMNAGYVFFLAVISSLAVAMCVHYLQLKAQITTQAKHIAVMESNLSQMKADNDALYNSVLASVDMEYVKNVAMSELGMNYPKQDQIYQFNTAGNSYVRQYRSVPDAE